MLFPSGNVFRTAEYLFCNPAVPGITSFYLSDLRCVRYHSNRHAAQVSPAPKPERMIFCPLRNIPLRFISSRRIGTVAAEVFAYSSRFIGNFEISVFSLFATASMILRFRSEEH